MGRGQEVMKDLEVREATHAIPPRPDTILSPRQPTERPLTFTVTGRTFGQPEDDWKAVWAAAKYLYHVFGEHMEITYDDKVWVYDPYAQDGEHQGHEYANAFKPKPPERLTCVECGCICEVCREHHNFGRHSKECYDAVVPSTNGSSHEGS